MTWVRVDDDVIDHPKTDKLARLLGCSRAAAVGLLVGVWGYAARYHQDGDLTDVELATLHRKLGWSSTGLAVDSPLGPEMDDVRNVLVESGWADRVDGRIVLHDWGDWQGKLIERRAKDRSRKRLQRQGGGSEFMVGRDECPQDEERSVQSRPQDVLRHTTRHDTDTNIEIEEAAAAAAADDVTVRLTSEGQTAFRNLCRAARNPHAFVAEVKAILEGMRAPIPNDPEAVSLALTDLVTNGVPVTANALRRFVQKAYEMRLQGDGAQKRSGRLEDRGDGVMVLRT
jgi:hypothetical protein